MSALEAQRRRLDRAMNATPAEQAALTALAAELGGAAPTPCPSCGGAMGDGDRVMYGRCARCRNPRGPR